jgi:hypothetical protein
MEEVVMRGLSKDPSKRYTTVVEFAAALEHATVAEVDAEQGSLFERLRALLKR